MKKNYRKSRVLALITFIMMYSLASAANNAFIFPYQIGDTGPAGGIVFFVHSNGQHGLEAAPADQSAGIQWYNGTNTDTEAHGDGVGAGEMNTMLIIANQGSDSNSYAAGLCANLVITNAGVDYGDWYMPSKEELNLMYSNLFLVDKGGFSNSSYWNSSESSTGGAWYQYFYSGSQSVNLKEIGYKVRAVRAF